MKLTKPIIITGMHRSGTTLLVKLLEVTNSISLPSRNLLISLNFPKPRSNLNDCDDISSTKYSLLFLIYILHRIVK